MNEVEVPLTEQLKSIPQSARIVIEEQYSSQNIPIGKLCHDAAKRIEHLEALNDALNLELGNPIDFDNYAKHQRVSSFNDLKFTTAEQYVNSQNDSKTN